MLSFMGSFIRPLGLRFSVMKNKASGNFIGGSKEKGGLILTLMPVNKQPSASHGHCQERFEK